MIKSSSRKEIQFSGGIIIHEGKKVLSSLVLIFSGLITEKRERKWLLGKKWWTTGNWLNILPQEQIESLLNLLFHLNKWVNVRHEKSLLRVTHNEFIIRIFNNYSLQVLRMFCFQHVLTPVCQKVIAFQMVYNLWLNMLEPGLKDLMSASVNKPIVKIFAITINLLL